jgi:hypothetical protein
MGWTKNVFSSNASSVGWNDETQEIEITWNSGKTSAYAGGTEELAEQCANAPSVGQFINSEIKSLSHRYV